MDIGRFAGTGVADVLVGVPLRDRSRYGVSLRPAGAEASWTGTHECSVFSLLPWVINSLIVLPALGQGVFGYRTRPPSGIAYFFVAN